MYEELIERLRETANALKHSHFPTAHEKAVAEAADAIEKLQAYLDLECLVPICTGCEGMTEDGTLPEKCGYPEDVTRCTARLDRLRELAQADKEGRCVVLPCKVGSIVYAIKTRYFDCDNCEHGQSAEHNPVINRRCCDMQHGQECPLYVEENRVEGFEIGIDKDGRVSLSGPGEFGCEGLEQFYGIDGQCYYTREDAEKALKERESE